ncbi:MAG: aspartate carbamoyltransferase regulatory subunit [Deltaproteobacteria bacterium]|nr:aspartate carbamoyltransferase regulatory subunit [Deltaproteobacteria bacterium]
MLHIPKIEKGTVIDHIPAGFGLKILAIIHRYPEMTEVVATVGLNYPSSKLGRKDLIKLETEELPARVLQHIAVVCAGVSIKRVKNYQVDKKIVVALPELMVGQARCRNPSCITQFERDVVTRFRCVDAESQRFRCAFCERIFPLNELELIA